MSEHGNTTPVTQGVPGSEEQLRFVLNAAGIGTWDMNIDQRMVHADSRCKSLFGFAPEDKVPYDAVLKHIHPDDRTAVDIAVTKALDLHSGGHFDLKYRVAVPATGIVTWLHGQGKASFDDGGKAVRFSGIVKDISADMQADEKVIVAERHAALALEAAGAGSFSIDFDSGHMDYSNNLAYIMTGDPNAEFTREMLKEHVHVDDRALREKAYEEADRTHFLRYEARFVWKNGSVHWVKVTGRYYPDADGKLVSFSGIVVNIDPEIAARKEQQKFRTILQQAPVGISLLKTRNLIIETANAQILSLWGKTPQIIGLPLSEGLPEIQGQGFIELLQGVYDTGQPFHGNEILARIERNGVMTDGYFNFVYTPLLEPDGRISGVMVAAIDVSAQIHNKHALEESERRFKSLVQEAPVAMGLFVGRNLVIEVANDPMLGFWGKGNRIMGMELAEALPELKEQPFLKVLDEIFDTGIPHQETEARVELVVDGKPRIFYFDYTYQPIFDDQGKVYAILDVAIDVTERVLSRRKEMEAQKTLQSAVEIANLGTWQWHPLQHEFICSDRIKTWIGLEPEDVISIEDVMAATTDSYKIREALTQAIAPDSNGRMDVEYNLVNPVTRQEYVMHTQGQVFYNEEKQAYLVLGTTQDVTLQRQVERTLELEVAERTEELAASNEELAATNEELQESNESLIRSNMELEQYAYVASHDLQEPLRKIQVFSSMLQAREDLVPAAQPMVDKIIFSAQRMALLIKDLLEFSRLLKSDPTIQPTNLTRVMKAVENDFELIIEEKKAYIHIGKLPTIRASSLQMNQLFYNLLSNALKFTVPGSAPHIEIHGRPITHQEAAKYINKPAARSNYYDITFADNGIGFEVKYTEQIFEVFKRLHGRDIYPGSGIGLALCRRIVTNHGGYLFAESEVGKGTTFHVIMPDR